MQQFIYADAEMPKEVALPIPSHRQVVKELVSRREFSIVEVIEALKPIAQPELLATAQSYQSQTSIMPGQIMIDGIISPIPKKSGL